MSVRHYRCRCGAQIIANDARKMVSHAAPECDWFRSLMKSGPAHHESVEVLDTETGEPVGSRGGKA